MVEDTIFVVQYQHILLRNFCCLTNFWLSSKWASVFQCTFSNGTNQRDKGHERISEAVNSDGHDLFFFTSKFKAGTLVLSVHCIVKNIRLCVGLKVHSVVWMVDISLEIFYRHVPTVKSLSYQFNKSSCTIIVLFCKIQAYFLSPNNHTILNFWSRCFRKWCTGDNWRSQTTASLQEEDQGIWLWRRWEISRRWPRRRFIFYICSYHHTDQERGFAIGNIYGAYVEMLYPWEGVDEVLGLERETLMSLYTCAGCGLEAEHQLLEMKVLGREPDT
jgi:hypothetical protein